MKSSILLSRLSLCLIGLLFMGNLLYSGCEVSDSKRECIAECDSGNMCCVGVIGNCKNDGPYIDCGQGAMFCLPANW